MACGPTSVQTIRAQNDPIYALSLTAAGPVSGASWANLPMTLEQGAILIGHGSMPTPLGTSGQGAWVESDLNNISSATGVTYAFQLITAIAPVNPRAARSTRPSRRSSASSTRASRSRS